MHYPRMKRVVNTISIHITLFLCFLWGSGVGMRSLQAGEVVGHSGGSTVRQSIANASDTRAKSTDTRHVVIGTREAPPLAYRDAQGEWTGLSIELWRRIAANQHITYEIRPYSKITELLDGVALGQVDIAVAGLTVTPERAERLALTHPYAPADLGIAVRARPVEDFSLGAAFLRPQFLRPVMALGLLLLVVGASIWVFERRHNPRHFGGTLIQGLFSGVWWSAVTMATVGYGDKVPVTVGGRMVGLVWMFSSILMISSVTGAIASSMTLGGIQPILANPQDLMQAHVGTLEGSSAMRWIDKQLIPHQSLVDTTEGLQAVASGRLDAFVNDELVLRHRIRQGGFQVPLTVLKGSFCPAYYAFAMRKGDPLLDAIDLELLRVTATQAWVELLNRYLDRE